MGREALRADIRSSCKIWGDDRRWNARHWFERGERVWDLRAARLRTVDNVYFRFRLR